MKKLLLILAPKEFRDLEFIVPNAFFINNNISVTTTSSVLNSIGRFGYVVNHKGIISDYINKDFDGIVFVGGTGSLIFGDNIELKDLTKRYLDTNKLVASICASSRNLIKWGLVDGREITGHNWDNNFKKIAEDAGAKTHLENVAVSGNLITGYGPEAVEEFSNAIIKYLNK